MAQTLNWIDKQDLILQFGVVDLPLDDNGDVSDEKITEAISTGVTQIEAYIRPTGITIPFSTDIQSELKLYLTDVVRYHYSNSVRTSTNEILERYQAAIAYLNKVSSGQITLSESATKKSNSISMMTIIRG